MRKKKNVIIADIPLGLHWNIPSYFYSPVYLNTRMCGLKSDRGNALEPKYNCADCC